MERGQALLGIFSAICQRLAGQNLGIRYRCLLRQLRDGAGLVSLFHAAARKHVHIAGRGLAEAINLALVVLAQKVIGFVGATIEWILVDEGLQARLGQIAGSSVRGTSG